jgi:hypothetical protein
LFKILSMRSIVVTMAFVVIHATLTSAQGVFSNRTQSILEKVIQDSANEHYSWSRTVFETTGFTQARDKYREIYGQISNSIITTAGRKTFILTGSYENPVEVNNSTHIVFTLLPRVGEVRSLKVELSLRRVSKGWKVALSVYDRDPKAEEEGAVTIN